MKEEKDNFIFVLIVYVYILYMYCVVYEGYLGDIIVVILFCYWLYYEIGECLKEC